MSSRVSATGANGLVTDPDASCHVGCDVDGFTEGEGSSQRFGALLLGAHRKGKLHYFGHSDSGFSEKGINDAIRRMKPGILAAKWH